MSMYADIESTFEEFIKEYPELRERIIELKKSVYWCLEWDVEEEE